MYSTILATTLAVATATKSTVTFPAAFNNIKTNSIKTAKKHSADSGQLKSLAVDSKLKAEGINMRTTHFNDPGNFFEIAYIVGTDCDATNPSNMIGKVSGWQMGRCMNDIEKSSDLADGKAETSSYILSEPNDEGFPMITYFEMHGCNPDNAYHTERMDKQEHRFGGFPDTYTAGKEMLKAE